MAKTVIKTGSAVGKVQSRPLLVIEFVGGPGSGKSTLAKALIETLLLRYDSQNGTHVDHTERRMRSHQSSLSLTLRVLLAAMSNPNLVWRAGVLFWNSQPKRCSNIRFFLSLLVYARDYPKSHGISIGNRNVNVRSQGILQTLWSALATSEMPSCQSIRDFLSAYRFNFDHVTVHLYCPIETALNRMRLRQTFNSRFDRMPDHKASMILDRLTCRFPFLVDQWASGRESLTLRIDTSDSVERNVQRLIDGIQRYLD